MARLSLSDIVEAQGAQVETLLAIVREQSAQMGAFLAAQSEARKPTASEEIVLSRSKLADKATGVDVKVVPQAGESLSEAALRGAQVFEAATGRYPLPTGAAHAAPLGADLESTLRATLDQGNGLHAVPEPEPVA